MTPDDASLSRLERAVCAVVGLATGAAGTVAVFVDGSNVGGVPLLIGAGALFGYLAVSGQRLSHLKVGGNEASFIGRILRDPTVSDEAKAEVAERLEDVPLPAGTQRAVNQVLDARAAAIDYRQRVIAAVRRVCENDLRGLPMHEDTPFADLLLGTGEPIEVAIEWTDRPQSSTELTDLLRRTAGNSVQALGLIISNQPLAARARHETSHELWLGVSWNSPADDARVAAALRELLES